MRINDLELKTGLDRATIRYYEKEGMITPQREENGYRNYSESDRQQLLKIKLLRQLDIPLAKIKQLQQGSEDLQNTINEQIQSLNQRADAAQRSAQVCMLMQTDGVTYAGLNAGHYIRQLDKMPIRYPQEEAEAPKFTHYFQEHIPVPNYPLRHFVARMIDWSVFAMLLIFLQAVIFRLGWNTWLIDPTSWLAALAFVPVEALCYRLFAATPGKLAMGISIFHSDGCKHSFSSGISRAFGAYRYGYGWGIPGWSVYRLIRSKINYSRQENEWNDESEVIYHPWGWRQVMTWVLLIAIFTAMILTTYYAVNLPKYRGNSINIEQFSENFNDYWARSGNHRAMGMNSDGTFIQFENHNENGAVVVIGGRNEPYADLEYLIIDGAVRGFSCTDEYEFASLVNVLPSRYMIASIALLASQPGEGTKSLEEFNEELTDRVQNAMQSGINRVTYETERFILEWSIAYSNCKYVGMTTLISAGDDSLPSTIKLSYSFKLQDTE